MSYEIRMTAQAKADLRGIYEYITFTLLSPLNAASQLNRIEERVAALSEMPERHRLYDKEPWRSRNLRIMPVNNYLIFYIPNSEEKVVTIVRVLYGGRDVERQLNS